MLFVGHVGKLIKVAGGIKNTHSAYGDHRMEIIADILEDITSKNEKTKAINKNVKDPEIAALREKILNCVMTEDALNKLDEKGLLDPVFKKMTELVKEHMEAWSDGKLDVENLIFTMDGRHCATGGTEQMFAQLKKQEA